MSFSKQLLCVSTSLIFFVSSVIANETGESPERTLTGFENITDKQPLWEFGVAGGGFDTSNYPGSSKRNFIALATHYLVYRGDVIRIGGGGGLRAVVIEKSDFELDLTFGGSFPAQNGDNSIRTGMPELDYLVEVGPQLVYRLKDYEFEDGGDARLKARFKARAAFSTDLARIDERGYVIEPTISYQQRGRVFKETSLNISLSSTFATQKFQEYFYQVPTEFSTPERMAYEAEGGYLGTSLSVSVSFPITDTIRGYLSGTSKSYHGAANVDSPLYEEDTAYSIGLGFVWRLYESETKASW